MTRMYMTQFHRCNAYEMTYRWPYTRFKILRSYDTNIAIVDTHNSAIYAGRKAEGYSGTTTRQFHRMCNEWYPYYKVYACDDERTSRFLRTWHIPEDWDNVGVSNAFSNMFDGLTRYRKDRRSS